MFMVRIPLLPVLQEVVSCCCLPYASMIREVSGDGVHLVGIELELPLLFSGDAPRRLFFWAPENATDADPFEAPILQALQCLQSIYRFSVIDYTSDQLAVYLCLARRMFSVANAGARLARLILSEFEAGLPCPHIVLAAEELLQGAHSIADPL